MPIKMPVHPEQFVFSVDLVSQAFHQINILASIDQIPELKNRHFLSGSLYRYENYWLPLTAAHPGECLSAPLDIEFIWHCHMLSPKAYARDCMRVIGSVANHALKPVDIYKRDLEKAEALWNSQYPSEPFHANYESTQAASFTSKLSYNVLDAAMRQKDFYYQVSLPHYRNVQFLEEGLKRYKKFLYLRQQLPKEFLVPCYDVDLFWHAHQLNPLAYKHDMVKYTGDLFDHDDSVTDRSAGSKLYNADKRTRDLWRQFFNEAYSKCGAMYRGAPPSGLYDITQADLFALSTKITTVHIDSLSVQIKRGSRLQGKLKLAVFGALNDYDLGTATKLAVFRKSPRQSENSNIVWSQEELRKCKAFGFNTQYHKILLIMLSTKTGFPRCTSGSKIGEHILNFSPYVEKPHAMRGSVVNIKAPVSDGINVNIAVRTEMPTKGPAVFRVEQGQFQRMTIPVLEPTDSGICDELVAVHRLKNHMGDVDFTCRIIHSVRLMQSVVQVFYHDQISAMAQLVGYDQLPLPSQVRSTRSAEGQPVTLNPREGERAVLIKNNKGDWGIVTGKWTGFIKGVAGVRGTRWVPGVKGVVGSPGTLAVSFSKLPSGICQKVVLQYIQKKYVLSVGSAEVDLMKGQISVSRESSEIAENLALAFSIALLHVLCTPRPNGWTEGTQVMPNSTMRGPRPIRCIPSDYMRLVLAAGLLCKSPSNFYIRSSAGFGILSSGGVGDGGGVGCDGGCGGGGCGGGGCGGGGCGGGGCGGGGCGGGGCGGDGGGCGGGCGGGGGGCGGGGGGGGGCGGGGGGGGCGGGGGGG